MLVLDLGLYFLILTTVGLDQLMLLLLHLDFVVFIVKIPVILFLVIQRVYWNPLDLVIQFILWF